MKKVMVTILAVAVILGATFAVEKSINVPVKDFAGEPPIG